VPNAIVKFGQCTADKENFDRNNGRAAPGPPILLLRVNPDAVGFNSRCAMLMAPLCEEVHLNLAYRWPAKAGQIDTNPKPTAGVKKAGTLRGQSSFTRLSDFFNGIDKADISFGRDLLTLSSSDFTPNRS
jgi:hypothetical protein